VIAPLIIHTCINRSFSKISSVGRIQNFDIFLSMI